MKKQSRSYFNPVILWEFLLIFKTENSEIARQFWYMSQNIFWDIIFSVRILVHTWNIFQIYQFFLNSCYKTKEQIKKIIITDCHRNYFCGLVDKDVLNVNIYIYLL